MNLFKLKIHEMVIEIKMKMITIIPIECHEIKMKTIIISIECHRCALYHSIFKFIFTLINLIISDLNVTVAVIKIYLCTMDNGY